MWKFDEPIKSLEMLSAKINIKEEIEPIEVAKELVIKLKGEIECKQD